MDVNHHKAPSIPGWVLALPPEDRFPGWPNVSGGAGELDNALDGIKDMYPSKALVAMANFERPFTREMLSDIPAGSKVSEGYLKFNALMNSPQNVAQIKDGATLPTPKDRLEKRFALLPTLFPGTFIVGWAARRAIRSNKSGFNNGEVSRRTEETVEDVAKHIERVYCSGHGTGRLARVLSDGANSFIADVPEGIQLLRENMVISVRTTDGGDTVRDSLDNRTITAINRDTRSVTYSGADQTAVAGDSVHIVAEAAQTGLSSLSAMGIRGIVDDGTLVVTFQGLSRTTYPKLKAIVKGNGGVLRNLTELLLVNGCHEVRQRSSKRPTHAWSNTGQIEKYIEFVAPDRRFPQQGGNVGKYATGYEKDSLVHYAPGIRLSLNISYDMVARELYILAWDTFFHYEAQPLDWWDEGSMLKPVPVAGGFKAAFFAAVCAIENIGCDMPIANLVYRDLRDPLIGD